MNLRLKLVHYSQEVFASLSVSLLPQFPSDFCLFIQTLEKHALTERELYLKYLIILFTSWHRHFLECDLFLTSLSVFEYTMEITRPTKKPP